MPIGQTPGCFFFKGIRWYATKAIDSVGSAVSVAKCQASRELHKFTEASSNEVHKQHHPYALIPEGPAALSMESCHRINNLFK